MQRLKKMYLALMITLSLGVFVMADDKAATVQEKVASTAPEIGQKAVDFTLPYATKDTLVFEGLKLSNLYGKGAVVLAF